MRTEQGFHQLTVTRLNPVNCTFQSLGGVPVLRRPTGKPNCRIFFESFRR